MYFKIHGLYFLQDALCFFRTAAARQNTFIVSFENYAKTELSIIYNVCVVVWRRVNRGRIYRKGTKKIAEGLESA